MRSEIPLNGQAAFLPGARIRQLDASDTVFNINRCWIGRKQLRLFKRLDCYRFSGSASTAGEAARKQAAITTATPTDVLFIIVLS